MMNFKQNLTGLFWLYRQKAKADRKAPIYARITIDGKYTEISTGKKVNLEALAKYQEEGSCFLLKTSARC